MSFDGKDVAELDPENEPPKLYYNFLEMGSSLILLITSKRKAFYSNYVQIT